MRTSALIQYHLPNRIRQLALDQPAKMAIRNELNEEISYKQLYDAALSVSNVIKSSENIGNSIAIMSKDPIQLAIGIFGAWFSNKAAVPLRNRSKNQSIII